VEGLGTAAAGDLIRDVSGGKRWASLIKGELQRWEGMNDPRGSYWN